MSTIKVNSIQNTSGVEVYTAKAWVNFNGTGTVAIRASGNVSSITDNGVGDYTVNFATVMVDANYAASCTAQRSADFGAMFASPASSSAPTTSGLRVVAKTDSAGLEDAPYFHVAIFR